ncbi:MAG: alpha/beta hydrolase family protein [Actinomadura sp.]
MRPRSVLCRLGSLVAAVALVLTGAAPASAAVAPAPGVPGDQPLPPYTISNPPLAPVLVNGEPTRVLQGVHEHAAYGIEVPPNWNGELAMWAHGFRGQGTVLTVDPPGFGLRQKLLDQGYAWAASSYFANGYDVRAGVLSTHDLAEHFGELVGRPHRTFITGVSMGGHVIGRSLEQFPRFYAGGLPMCGVLGDNTLFDFFLDYNLVAQDLADIDAFPAPADYVTNAVPRIERALGIDTLAPGGPDTTNDLGKQLRAITINRTGGDRPGAVAAFPLWKDFLFTLAEPPTGDSLAQDPGQVATNLLTRYTPDSPVNVNRSVERVPPASPGDRFSARLSEVPQIFGVPRVPVLSLHGLGDMFVPFSMEQAYRSDVARHGRSSLLVQRAIRTSQHCEFSAPEAGAAWDDLVTWVRAGVRPAGDDVTRPSAADFGCRFSDRAAFDAGSGTRRLYTACP